MGANEFSMSVINWCALSPGLETQDDWISWAANECRWPDAPAPVKADAIPSLIRRRVSSLTKMGLQTALTLAGNRHIDYAVFSSRHGELSRTTRLIQDILAGADASPTAFSQSVHNTTAGLFTIVGARPIPVTSVAAGHDGFHEAMIDAAAYLAGHPEHTVMLVDFDEALPEPYHVYDPSPYPGHALGLLLSSGTAFSCRGIRVDDGMPPTMPQALGFLAAFLSGQEHWECVSSRYRWSWTRKPA